MKTITLTQNQYKLLIKAIEDQIDTLQGQGCNDIYREELEHYSEKELEEILMIGGKEDFQTELKTWLSNKKDGDKESWHDYLKDGPSMFSDFPLQWLLKKIKSQK